MLARVVLASDDRYTPTMSVAVQSVIDTSDADNKYEITILSDGISGVNKEKLKSMIVGRRNFSIDFFDAEKLLAEHDFSLRTDHISRCAYARVALPDIMPNVDKVVYIDGDVILRRDIAGLGGTDICESLVAAVPDPYISVLRAEKGKIGKYIDCILGLGDEDMYFNSGVLVMNLAEFRRRYTSRYILEMGEYRRWMWEDQDVLNVLCKGSVKQLPLRWNVVWGMIPEVREKLMRDREYANAFADPYIIHFAGGCLPMKCKCNVFEDIFWETADRTPFKDELHNERKVNRKRAEQERNKTDYERKAGAFAVAEAARAKRTAEECVADLGMYMDVSDVTGFEESRIRRVAGFLPRSVCAFMKKRYSGEQGSYNRHASLALYDLARLDFLRKDKLNKVMLECEMLKRGVHVGETGDMSVREDLNDT